MKMIHGTPQRLLRDDAPASLPALVSAAYQGDGAIDLTFSLPVSTNGAVPDAASFLLNGVASTVTDVSDQTLTTVRITQADATPAGKVITWASQPTWLNQAIDLASTATIPASPAVSWFGVAPDESSMVTFANWSMGCVFTTSAPVTITQLGRFYAAANVQDHRINLWDNAGALLLSATVLAASASDADGVKWADVTPYALAAGTYRLAATEDSDSLKNEWTATLVAPFSDLFTAFYNDADVFPTYVGTAGKMYSAPAIKFTT